jgi:hypothetical protein
VDLVLDVALDRRVEPLLAFGFLVVDGFLVCFLLGLLLLDVLPDDFFVAFDCLEEPFWEVLALEDPLIFVFWAIGRWITRDSDRTRSFSLTGNNGLPEAARFLRTESPIRTDLAAALFRKAVAR